MILTCEFNLIFWKWFIFGNQNEKEHRRQSKEIISKYISIDRYKYINFSYATFPSAVVTDVSRKLTSWNQVLKPQVFFHLTILMKELLTNLIKKLINFYKSAKWSCFPGYSALQYSLHHFWTCLCLRSEKSVIFAALYVLNESYLCIIYFEAPHRDCRTPSCVFKAINYVKKQ